MSYEIEIQAEDRREYVPDVGTNVERCEAWDGTGEPPYFWVDLLPMSRRDLTKVQTNVARRLRKANSGMVAAGHEVVRRCIEQYVPAVHELVLTNRATGEKIKPRTGKELFDALEVADPALSVVIDDIEAALMDGSKADAGDLEKLRRRSDSSVQKDQTALLFTPGSVPVAAVTTTPPTTTTSGPAATATER